MPLPVITETQTKESTWVKEDNNDTQRDSKNQGGDKHEWTEYKEADFMGRLNKVNSELCGVGIKTDTE
jgi:hypothetical protein